MFRTIPLQAIMGDVEERLHAVADRLVARQLLFAQASPPRWSERRGIRSIVPSALIELVSAGLAHRRSRRRFPESEIIAMYAVAKGCDLAAAEIDVREIESRIAPLAFARNEMLTTSDLHRAGEMIVDWVSRGSPVSAPVARTSPAFEDWRRAPRKTRHDVVRQLRLLRAYGEAWVGLVHDQPEA